MGYRVQDLIQTLHHTTPSTLGICILHQSTCSCCHGGQYHCVALFQQLDALCCGGRQSGAFCQCNPGCGLFVRVAQPPRFQCQMGHSHKHWFLDNGQGPFAAVMSGWGTGITSLTGLPHTLHLGSIHSFKHSFKHSFMLYR